MPEEVAPIAAFHLGGGSNWNARANIPAGGGIESIIYGEIFEFAE